jgi:hypothetical protein
MGALAGAADALNELVEKGDLVATHPAAKEIISLVDGIPASDFERTAWLRQHWGTFIWDATAEKYRLAQKPKF